MFLTFYFHVLLNLVKISKLDDNFVYLHIKYNHFFIYRCITCFAEKYYFLKPRLRYSIVPLVELNFDQNNKRTVHKKILNNCKRLNVNFKM